MKFSGPGPVVRAGKVRTPAVTVSDWGLPVMTMPLLSTAASEMMPLYDPAERDADVTVTVNVAVLLLVTGAEAGETASQLPPLPVVAVGVMVTLPVQVPVTPTVKVCVVGFNPTSAE